MSASGIVQPGAPIRLGVISNPLSGGNREGLGRIAALLAGVPRLQHAEACTPSEVAAALREFARQKINLIAVNGGDGTVHAVLTEVFRRPGSEPMPMLALLRSGTASMIARDVGAAGPSPAALKRLLSWVSSGSGSAACVQRQILKVHSEFAPEPLYGMFFGAAGICQGIRYCLDRVHTRGVRGELAAGITLAKFLIAAVRRNRSILHPVPASVALDGERAEEREYLLLLVSTLERLFLGLRPYWATGNAPLYYTALGAQPQHVLRALPHVLRGRRTALTIPGHGYFSRKVREVSLTLPGGFTLDGELYGQGDHQLEQVRIEAGGTVSFLKV